MLVDDAQYPVLESRDYQVEAVGTEINSCDISGIRPRRVRLFGGLGQDSCSVRVVLPDPAQAPARELYKHIPGVTTPAQLPVSANWHNLRAGTVRPVELMRPRNLPRVKNT